MGPPPRSFAADAHDCIMVTDQPNTSLWRDLRAPDGELPSDHGTPDIDALRDNSLDKGETYKTEIVCTSRPRLLWLGLRIRGQAPRLRRAARGFGAL